MILSSRLWQAEAIRGLVLQRVKEAARAARQSGVRPRLVIFDYLDSPVAGQLRSMAQDLDMLVGVEPVERSLPGANLRDRFRLLEKSKGVHGIFFPSAMTDGHRACVEAHPILSKLDLDRVPDGLSPQVISFLQLASAHGWNPEGRHVHLVYALETRPVAQALAQELRGIGMQVTAHLHPAELDGVMSRANLVWMCHGRPVELARLHLPSDAVVVDSGRAFELGSSLTEAQGRLLAFRLCGLCPADGGMATLVNLNRIQRLLTRALGPAAKRRPAAAAVSRGKVRF